MHCLQNRRIRLQSHCSCNRSKWSLLPKSKHLEGNIRNRTRIFANLGKSSQMCSTVENKPTAMTTVSWILSSSAKTISFCLVWSWSKKRTSPLLKTVGEDPSFSSTSNENCRSEIKVVEALTILIKQHSDRLAPTVVNIGVSRFHPSWKSSLFKKCHYGTVITHQCLRIFPGHCDNDWGYHGDEGAKWGHENKRHKHWLGYPYPELDMYMCCWPSKKGFAAGIRNERRGNMGIAEGEWMN